MAKEAPSEHGIVAAADVAVGDLLLMMDPVGPAFADLRNLNVLAVSLPARTPNVSRSSVYWSSLH